MVIRGFVAVMLVGLSLSCASRVALAQRQPGGQRQAGEQVQTDGPRQKYLVQLTEFRWQGADDLKADSKTAIAALQKLPNDEVALIETIRLSTLSGYESLVQFGKSVTVTTGVVRTPGGQTRQTKSVQIGTMVRVSVKPDGDKLLVTLSYQASRMPGEGTEDCPPDTVTSQFETTLQVEADQPTLVAGTSAEESSYMVLTVARQ